MTCLYGWGGAVCFVGGFGVLFCDVCCGCGWCGGVGWLADMIFCVVCIIFCGRVCVFGCDRKKPRNRRGIAKYKRRIMYIMYSLLS